MKYIAAILTLIFLSSCDQLTNRTPRVQDRLIRDYRGKVKRIIEYACDKYWVHENPIRIDKNSCEILRISEFNEDEILTKEMLWNVGEYPKDPEYLTINKVDESGNIIETIRNKRLSDKKRLSFSFNQAGFQTEWVEYMNGKFSMREETVYDEYNCPIKEITYDENNKITHYHIYSYDEKNREISSTKYDGRDKLIYKTVKEYDDYYTDFDDLVVETDYDANGKITNKVDARELYKSNKIVGSWTPKLPYKGAEDIEYYTSKKVRSWHFVNSTNEDVYQTYDEEGRVIERKIYRNKIWSYTYSWKYREDGALLEESESTSRVVGKSYDKRTTYYRVDQMGNWVERYRIDEEGRLSLLATREFEYYN